MADTEAELEERVRARDADALVVYLELRKAPLLSFIERRLGADLRQRLDPDDVLQETALAALNELAQAADPPRDVFGWLCHLAGQRIVDLARHHRADKRDPRREVAGQAPRPNADGSDVDFMALLSASLTTASRAAVRGERQTRLQACLAELPETSREALRLRYGEGLSTREVAARLGKTDVAVRVLLSRTVQELQRRLEDSRTG